MSLRQIPLYQVDAFSDRVFGGNPAAVCPLDAWLPDSVLQAIAAENSLSETAFIVPRLDNYGLRWFTPVTEVDLCGHATLAAAFVIFTFLRPAKTEVQFLTKAGILEVKREGDLLLLNFPSLPAEPCEAPNRLFEALGKAPDRTLLARAYLAVFPHGSGRHRSTSRLRKACEIDAENPNRNRTRHHSRFCFTLFRAVERSAGRSCDRFSTLYFDSLMV
jgi:PhzF family phenazine biosynthesis protein